MFTIKICLRRNPETGEDASNVYAASSYRLSRFNDRCELSCDTADGNGLHEVIGGKGYHEAVARGETPPQAVYITNIDGRTVDSWRMHEDTPDVFKRIAA